MHIGLSLAFQNLASRERVAQLYRKLPKTIAKLRKVELRKRSVTDVRSVAKARMEEEAA